ncbi:hypothetical protein C8T65DRAFT_699886, partial [Cerioporus squamosus]
DQGTPDRSAEGLVRATAMGSRVFRRGQPRDVGFWWPSRSGTEAAVWRSDGDAGRSAVAEALTAAIWHSVKQFYLRLFTILDERAPATPSTISMISSAMDDRMREADMRLTSLTQSPECCSPDHGRILIMRLGR